MARAIAELDAHRTEGDVGDTARVHQQANAVAEKWNALDPATRQAVIDHETQAGHRSILGDLDGLPAQVRDRFNRHNLVEDMVHKHPGQEHAGAIRQWATEWEAHRRDPENVSQPDSNHKDFEKLPDTEPPKSRLDKVAKLFEFRSSETRSVERTWHETYRVAEGGRPRQLYLYDPQAFNGDGRIAVGIGDLDTAEAIAVNTPGITSTIRSIETNINNAENLQIRATQQTPEVRTASLAWIGYDAPSGLGLRHTARATFAEAGGHRLAHDVAGLHAARGGEDPAIHLFGHSYGSTTTAFAGEGGRLGSYVETVTLLGSPGAGPLAHAGDFGVGEHNVFVAANTADIVTLLGGAEGRFHQILGHFGLGLDPASSPFGATRITAQYLAPELTRGLIDPHTHYYASEGIDARGNPILLRDNAHVRVTESLDNFSHILTGHTERLNLEVAPHEPQHRFSDPTWMRRAEPATGYPGPNECARHTIEGFTERHGNEIEQPKDHGAQGVLRPDYEQALKTHFRDGCLDDIIAAARDGHSVIVVDTYHRADLPDGHPGSHTYSVEPNPADPNRPLVYDGDASGPRPWPPQGLDRVSRTEIATFHPDGTPTHPAEEPHALQGANDRIAGERTGARLDDGDALWQEGNRAPDHNGSHASQPAEQEMHPPGWDHIQSAEPMGPGWERASDEPIDPNETPHGDPRPDWDPGHAPFDPNRVDPETGKLWSDPTAPYGRDPDGNAYTEREYAERFHRLGPNGEHYVSYPPNGGAVRGTILDYHDAHQFVRDFTDKIDRIGKPEGKYLALMEGGQPAPFEARSLHYETLYQSHNSYTLNPDNVPPGWRIRISEAAPAQGRPGGCLQLVVVDAKGKEVPVRELKDDYGILR